MSLDDKSKDRPNAAIARHYRAARTLAGWNQQELGERAGVTLGTISRFENGGRTKPENVQAIMRVLEDVGIRFVYKRAMLSGVTYKDINGGKNVIRHVRHVAANRARKGQKHRAKQSKAADFPDAGSDGETRLGLHRGDLSHAEPGLLADPDRGDPDRPAIPDHPLAR